MILQLLLKLKPEIKPPCTSRCATTYKIWAIVGRVRYCSHGRIWKCYRVYPLTNVGLWRKLSVVWNYTEYKEASQTLNALEKEETL